MKLSLLLLLLPLAGCVTPGPQARSPQEIMAADPSTACGNRLSSDVFIASRIGQKIALQGAPTMEMMADRSKPAGEELQAISSLANTRQSCWALGASYRQANIPPGVLAVLDQRVQTGAILLSKLYAGDISFGEYNTRTVENRSSARADLLQIDQQIEQTNAQNDAARRAALASSLQNQMLIQQQQQIQNQQIYQMNRPKTTNCQRIGSQLNCTTF